MATGATGAIARAHPHQQAGNDQRGPTGVNPHLRYVGHRHPEQRRQRQAQQKQGFLAMAAALAL
ncbi:hypothetical protein D3C78_1701640 [compost metagenome]